MTGITWRGWGRSTAYGTGRLPIYRPQGNYYPPVLVRLKASRLGTCPGRSERAYTTLVIRYPQWPGGPLGSWRKWSSSRTICDYADTDPAYEYPRRGPGVCDEVGEYGEPDTVQSIHVYRLSCASARRAARRLTARERPFSCVKRGCTRRTGRLRCRLGRVRAGETTGYDYPYPVQRLSCRRGAATLSAFLVLSYD